MNALQPFLNKVTQGDCIHVLRRFPDQCIDFVLTDPPYLVRYQDQDGRKVANDDNPRWLFPAFAEVYRVLRPDRYCVSFYGWGKVEKFLAVWKELGLFPVGHFVFVKPYASRVGHTQMCHEQAYLLAKGRPPKPALPPADVIPFEYSGSIHEQLSAQFAVFERRGRGWQVFPEPVAPEPAFQPFTGYTLAPVIDDGRVPTAGSSLLAGLSRWLGGTPKSELSPPVQDEELEPTPLVRTDLIELQTSLPAKLNLPHEAFEAFLSQLAACAEPLSFELVGQPEQIHAQFALSPLDAPLVRRQLNAYFPEAVFIPTQGTLEPFAQGDQHHAIVEFGLARECLFPLASGGKLDPFIGLIGALSELREDERAVYQVLFQPCQHRWADSLLRSVTDPEGRSLFVNRPEFAGLVREKVSRPLYAAVVRLAATSDTFEGAWEIVRNLAGALRVFARTDGNELIPLHNEDYPYEAHGEDVAPADPPERDAAQR